VSLTDNPTAGRGRPRLGTMGHDVKASLNAFAIMFPARIPTT
jgi:hypothetical protein